jgi:serine/threonine protein kinase
MTASPPAPEYTRSAGDEPLPGYRLVAPLGRGGFGEVWRCVAPGGLPKAIKFVAPSSAPEPGQVDSLAQEYEAFLQVKAIRHPFLLTLERVEVTGGELVMVMELADKSLANRYDECLAAGAAGIPRDELLAYMVDVAEALDVLAQQHGLQHLDVKPANLFLIGGHVKVGDYGLVSRCLGADESRTGRGVTPRYVAPEILDGRVHLHSDQYPLALVYQELLTGTYPYPGPTARHLLTQHRLAEPNLSALGPADRPAVARALAKNPDERFPACLAFVRALLNGHRTATPPKSARPIPDQRPDAPTPPPLAAAADLSSAVTQRLQPGLTTPRSGGVVNLPRTPDDLTRTCPGYVQTAEPDSGPRGRKVKAADPTGRPVRVHLLRLDGGAAGDLDAVVRAVSAPHPHLWQQVSAPHPRTVGFVAQESQQPLADWLKVRAGQGLRPLRPAEAVVLLDPVAAALDDLNARCQFPHALVNSRTVLVENDRAGVTGYGAGELLRLSSADAGWLSGDPFVAPEVAAGQPTAASDQYSLALVYLEVVGAWAPQPRTRSAHSSAGMSVNWSALSEAALRAIRKALSADPTQRFATCREFLDALRPADSSAVVLDSVRLVESVARLTGGAADPPRTLSSGELVAAVLRAAGGTNLEGGDRPAHLPDGRLAVRFPVQWTPSFGRLKTNAFADQCGYTAVPVASDTVLLKPIPTRADPVELVVRWPVRVEAGTAEVSVTGRWTAGLDPTRGTDKVAGMLGRFRRLVQNLEDRRKAPRVRAEFAVTVYPVDDDLRVGAAIAGRCRDVSASGFAATLDAAPPGTHAFARFADVPEVGELAVLAKLVRSSAAPGGVVTGWRFVHAG